MTEIPQTEQGMQAMQVAQDEQELQGRQAGGRFGPGNRYGKGRPPRAIEASYMAALADIVPPERWAAICDKAAQDAEAGDKAAREWIGRHLLGQAPISLRDLARRELAGATDADEIEAANKLAEAESSMFSNWMREQLGYTEPIAGAIEIATTRDKSEADAARIALARAARLAKRLAKRDAELNQVVALLEGAKPDAEAEAKARADAELAAIPPEPPDWIARRLG